MGLGPRRKIPSLKEAPVSRLRRSSKLVPATPPGTKDRLNKKKKSAQERRVEFQKKRSEALADFSGRVDAELKAIKRPLKEKIRSRKPAPIPRHSPTILEQFMGKPGKPKKGIPI